MRNSQGQWEPRPAQPIEARLGDALARDADRWRPALSLARTLEGRGLGNLCKLEAGRDKRYGRELPLGTRRADGALALAPWLKRALRIPRLEAGRLESEVLPRLSELTGGGTLAELVPRGEQLVARLSFAEVRVPAWIDSHGAALLDPEERRELPAPCRGCPELDRFCLSVPIETTPAFAWRRFKLIEADGTPTRRGIVFSFFHHGEGLAVAAALEDESYALADLVFDLANLRAGPRFAGDDSPLGGRLGALCQRTYERADLPGYLEMGVPLGYGAGANEVVREIVEHGSSRQKLLTESLRPGDIERGFMEWRSLLRHIIWAPDYDWSRWRELKAIAARHVDTSSSPTLLALPPLTIAQQRRV